MYGGGQWTTQNKVLGGAYINFISAARVTTNLSERGVASMPLELDWGADNVMMEVAQEDFIKNSLTLFGYAYTDDKMQPLRELFTHATKAYIYKLTSGGAKAENTYATAKCCGIRGKDKSGWVEQVGKMDYVDYQTAYNKGYDFGQGVENKVSDFFGGIKDLGNSGDTGALGSYGAASDMAANVANIAGDTSSISDSLDVSEEDLKYLRDIAEQEAINRFTTAEIKVDMSGMSNTVHNTNDLDGIVDGLTTRVLEAMEIVRDGA